MTESTKKTRSEETLNPSLRKALECARAAIDKKGENVKILDISELSGFADYFVIISGMSDRQCQAIAQSLLSTADQMGFPILSAEGVQEGRWVLMDLGEVVVHIFLDALREYYDLEGLWSDAPKVAIPSEYYGPSVSRLN